MWIKKQLNKLTNYLVACSEQDYKPYQVTAAAIFGLALEMLVVPVLLVLIGKWVDGFLVLGRLFASGKVVGPSALAFCLGLVWMLWSIYTQHMQGKGTPLPLVPTKTLLVVGPYRYTRNPMAFGASFWLLGWAFLANSPAALLVVFCFILILIAYIKLVEEKELEQRFGREYVIYKQHTPFIIPRLINRH